MYSYADRLKAVQLYIKLGKRVGITIRQLGYPTKNALKAWYCEGVVSAFFKVVVVFYAARRS
ncbi:hypothetical protein [Aeromonas jandaei]|uniref:hypothetical protein n=1 Tax=Aeromonas jandaei TaxID=650 RepID=UPI0011172C32|nr:hypothetical protein CF104_20285 [Aeromonas jandaei]